MNETIKRFIAGEKPDAPFTIDIDGKAYRCDQVLRWLPGRRLVVKASHDNDVWLLKLFAPGRRGRRELLREQQGYQRCRTAGIAVPELRLSSDRLAGCYAVAYDFINEARPFSLSPENLARQLRALLDLMAQCHMAGIYQQDIHTDNILETDDGLYLIDVGAVKGQTGGALTANKSLKNLALLVAQFTPEQQSLVLQHVSHYFQARGWTFGPVEHTAFKSRVDKAWQKRKNHYLTKCFRPCTMTVYRKDSKLEYAFRRSFFQQMGEEAVRHLDSLVQSGEVLKAGNSATVVQTQLAGRSVVIKRYNIKSAWHFFKRCWRPSRAANAWRQGQMLELVGIATPKVWGFVEHRIGPLRKQAFLISDYINEADELSHVYMRQSPSENELGQIQRIFTLMQAYRLSHGDLKASNFMLSRQGKVELIDLDAMKEHRCRWTFQRAFSKDQQRFLANWQNRALQARFESIMTETVLKS